MLPNIYELEKLSKELHAEWGQLIQEQHELRSLNQEANENKKASKGSSLFRRLNPFFRNISPRL
jgi:hypothetical protein